MISLALSSSLYLIRRVNIEWFQNRRRLFQRGLIQLFNRFIEDYNIQVMSSKPVAGKGYSPNSKQAPSPPKQESPSKKSPPKGQPAPAKQPEQPKAKAPEPKKVVAKQPEAPAKGSFDARKYAVNGITEEEVTIAKTSFDLFDSDQGGTVDIKQLKAAMTSLGFESKSGTIFQMIADLDSDGSGTIDFQEWLNLLTKKVSDKDSRANISKIFALFDDERTGYISVKNLRRVAQQLGEAIGEGEIEELIARADTDHDGHVSEEEFYIIVTRKIKD